MFNSAIEKLEHLQKHITHAHEFGTCHAKIFSYREAGLLAKYSTRSPDTNKMNPSVLYIATNTPGPMLQFEANFVFAIRSCRELHVMKAS